MQEELGIEAQGFFQAEPEEVAPEISELSGKLVKVFEEDRVFFQRQSLANERRIIQLLEALSTISGAQSDLFSVTNPEFQNDIDITPQSGSAPVLAGQPYLFTRYLLRTLETDPVTGRRYRKITFRVRRNRNHPPARNVLVKAYLLVTRLFIQPDRTIGHGKHWVPLLLTRTDNFIPRLSNYWSVSHLVDPKVGQVESGFMRFVSDPTVVDTRIRIYISGEVRSGEKDYGEWEYDWTSSGTKFGTFRLRPLGQQEMTDELFDDVVEDEVEESVSWPLLDVANLEKRITETNLLLNRLDDETV